MAIEGLNRTNYNPKPAETEKPKIPVKPAAIQNTDNRDSVVGAVKNAENLVKFKVNNLLDGIFAAKTPAAPTASPGIFTDKGDGIEPGKADYVSPYDSKAKPEEAATFLKYDTAFNTPSAKSQAFAEALEMHKNDPAWTKDFLSAVGTKKVAEYTSGIYQMENSNKTQIDKYSNTVRSTLENLVKSGDLKQEGMNSLVEQLKNRDAYTFGEIFGKSNDDNFKQSFIKAAADNGDNRLEAAASTVLAGMSSDKQSAMLTQLDKDGKLNSFIQGAMSGQQEMVTLDYHLSHPDGGIYTEAPKTKLGSVERLMQTAAIQTGYNGSSLQQAPFSRDLQVKLFNAASQGLDDPKALENFKDNTAFKTAISDVFIANRDDIFNSVSSSENGAITENGEKGLERFFQTTLMTPPRGDNYEKLSHSVFSFINDATTALSDPKLKSGDRAAFDAFTKAHGGKSPEDYTQMLGGVLGTIVDGAGNAQVEINKNNKEKEKQIEFFTGLAFAMVPGAGSALSKGISNEFVKHFAEKGTEYFQGKGLDSIKESINKGLSGLASEKSGENGQLANTLFRQLLEKLPNGDAVYSPTEKRMVPTINLQEQLLDGFNNTTRYTISDAAKAGN